MHGEEPILRWWTIISLSAFTTQLRSRSVRGKRRERTVLKKKGPPGERDKPSSATRYTIKDWISFWTALKNHPEILNIDSSRSVFVRYIRGPSPLYIEERHHAPGRDATFSWSRALTHPPRCNRTRHRGRHLVSDFVGSPSWIGSHGGRHLGPEVMGAAILDLKSWGPPSWIWRRDVIGAKVAPILLIIIIRITCAYIQGLILKLDRDLPIGASLSSGFATI